MNVGPDHLILEHKFSWNTFADVDLREKDHKSNLNTMLQEEYYNYFPKCIKTKSFAGFFLFLLILKTYQRNIQWNINNSRTLFPVSCFESTFSNTGSQAQLMQLLCIVYMTTHAEKPWRIWMLYTLFNPWLAEN